MGGCLSILRVGRRRLKMGFVALDGGSFDNTKVCLATRYSVCGLGTIKKLT